MVSVADLLNPEPPRAPLPTSRPTPVSPIPRTAALRDEPSLVSRSIETLGMMDNTNTPLRPKAGGAIHFPPFETLDEASLREVRKFQVHPLGSIRETCERIPYNSGKKDFFSKTGREGFEAFHYEFRVPGDDTSYTVMWDYNVGLVRMTSFFKCRGYSKTTPAKMLNSNPGLKDITYSITGGSIKAQGYWMPYICARAICATFCHSIAGALIPLFGPQFPFECIPEKAPGHGRMIINPELVTRAANDAAALFRPPPGLPSPRPSRSVSPLPSQRSARVHIPYDYQSDHGHDRRLLLSPYTDTDVDYHPGPEPYGHRMYPAIPPMRIPTSRPPFGPAPVPTPLHSPSWTAVNHPQLPAAAYHHRAVSHLNEELNGLNVSATANPYLSAVPRSPTPAAGGAKWHPYYPRSHHHDHHYQHTSSPVSTSLPERGITLPPLRLKRRFDQVDGTPNGKNTNYNDVGDDDKAYDAEEEEEAEEDTHPSTTSPPSSPSSSSNQHSIRTPPPTTTLTSSATVNTTTTQGGWSKPAQSTPSSHTSIPTTTAATHEHEHMSRRASERDAAIMLLHMRGPGPGRGLGHGNAPPPSLSSSSGPPSPSSEESSSSSSSSSEEDSGGGRKGAGKVAVDGRMLGKKEVDKNKGKGEGKGKSGGDGEEGGVGGGGMDGGRGVCSLPVAGDADEVAVAVAVGRRGGGGGGPNTRAKRRRTVER